MSQPERSLKSAMQAFLSRYGISNGCLVIGVSGGADSVALLILLSDLSIQFNLNLCVGHFDHQLRPESGEDALWVQRLCRRLGVRCEVGVPGDPAVQTQALHSEELARNGRYRFLEQVAARHHAPWLAIAHTANDQAETILHHIVRGTGLTGLKGIPESRPVNQELTIIRPLLQFKREELLAFLNQQGESFLIDESNRDLQFTRNRLRHVILPELRQHFNPQVDEALLRLSEQAAEAEEVIRLMALKVLRDATPAGEVFNGTRLSIAALCSQPQAVLTRVFIEFWKIAGWPRQKMSQDHWKTLASMVQAGVPRGHHCPGGIEATVRRGFLEIRRVEPQNGDM